ncbi:MAG: ComEC/Rec2 family competence protein [Nakamurella sp.]
MSRRWTEAEAQQPLDLRLAIPALAVWLGCLVAVWAPAAVPWAVAALGVALIGCGAATRRGWLKPAAVVAALTCCLAALVLTSLRFSAAAIDPLVGAADAQDWVVVEVTVLGDPAPVQQGWDSSGPRDASADAGRWRLGAKAKSVTVHGMSSSSHSPVTIFADGGAWGAVRDGQTIRLQGTAQPDEFGALPGVVIRARGQPQLMAAASPWTRWATHARERLAHSARALDADQGGLLRGLVVGDTRGIDEQLSADAKTSGLTHLVAVSGTHMAIAAGAILLLFRRFGPRISGVAVAAAFAVLVILVGPQPSVLRAVTMGLIAISAAVVGRSKSALSALSATVFGLLLVDPALAVSVGFALSVQATAGLILLAPVLTRALERRRVPRGWAMVISIPVAAHLATIPVITAISGAVSLVAIPANIAVTPVVAPALLLGLGCLIVGVIWPAAGELVARIDGPLLGWITGTAHRLAHWPWATVPWSASTIGVWALAALIVVGLVIFRFRASRSLVIAAALGAVLVVIGAQLVSIGWPGRGWIITMCDVGQGDGIVLSTDVRGTAVVVDTGPDPSAMDSCLARLGVSTIALLVVTHLHADHVGGLSGAVRGRTVDAIGIGPDKSSPRATAELGALSRVRGIPITRLTSGAKWASAGLRIDVLGPTRQFRGTESDPNNESVVLRATHSGIRMLLTGDIERPAQQALLDVDADLKAEVLKQPHHGSSKLLPEFVAAVDADVAVIGVGADNDYGHPSQAALQRDLDAGISRILRTDTDGEVQVVLTQSGLGTVARGTGSRDPAAP